MNPHASAVRDRVSPSNDWWTAACRPSRFKAGVAADVSALHLADGEFQSAHVGGYRLTGGSWSQCTSKTPRLPEHSSALNTWKRAVGVAWLMVGALAAAQAGPVAVTLPPEVKAVWELDRAYHETTPTRERVCINGLWRWQPAESAAKQPPVDGWGYYKVPGSWPGITDYLQKDCQTLYAQPQWNNTRLGELTAAWYERTLAIPEAWRDRRIALSVEYLNSYAAVYVDGRKAGEVYFPGGELDLTGALGTKRMGAQTHTLSLLVAAMPLKGVMLSYTDSASAREVKGSVARRGLCGDVWLVSTPRGPRITEVNVETSVRKKECVVRAALDGLAPGQRYSLHARIFERGRVVKEFSSGPFDRSTAAVSAPGDVMSSQALAVTFLENWLPPNLWDLDAPQYTYHLEVSLMDGAGKVVDSGFPERFGFREFWIDGRDFYLNGTRLFLSAVPLDNAEVSAAAATYAGARESLERLKSFGINYVYTHNYGCQPGSHLCFSEILRAADDVGMLVGFSQPHFSHYDWSSADADRTNGYARHAEYYVRAAGNHPSVVLYSMSHNATGYDEDMNPDLIDGIHDARDTWALRNMKLALRAEAIVRGLDPVRIVYHHASGNLGSMHAINFYPNFVPIQELSDWFEHWATQGVKPVFTCEFGAPFTWDWTMYRGWYQGQREFGSAVVPWEFCNAEWNAQFVGDRAFQISDAEKLDLRWEAKQFQAGKRWHRWDYPVPVGSSRFDDQYPIFARYLTDNWRAFRTWGVSAISPWEHEHFWKVRDGVDRRRRDLPVDWQDLQRPGFSPDYLDQRYERMDMAFDRGDWIATEAAQALIRNNRPLLAYVGGKPERFTSKDHNFLPGEMVVKQGIVLNNSRRTVRCDCRWSLALPRPISGRKTVTVATGEQARIPLRFELPSTLAPGAYTLHATFQFSTGEMQEDQFSIDVLGGESGSRASARNSSLRSGIPTRAANGVSATSANEESVSAAVFDPKGETTALLNRLGIRTRRVAVGDELSTNTVLILGKSALTVDGPAPDLSRVRAGLKVIVFEQASDVLEKRLGFRVEEYGLRQVFGRIPDHPALAGLTVENLHDWRGEATILPPRLKYTTRPRYGPTVEWGGLLVTRLWRCGNRGNVASVLIEKPACGDFLPIVDGGFDLQYSPLLEYREGRGLVVFCQMDVSGRTETDPAADALVANLLRYVRAWAPKPRRKAIYVGEPGGAAFLKSVGVSVDSSERLAPGEVLVVGPGGGGELAPRATEIADWLKTGGELLALGVGEPEANSFLPFSVRMNKAEHISTFFEPFSLGSSFTGVGPADVHNRDPREFPLLSGGAQLAGDGVLAKATGANVVFCQMAPWQFADHGQANLRRTRRRVSFLVSRLLANLGVEASTPLLERFPLPSPASGSEARWLSGLYVDWPEEWDDPYRHFRW